MASLLNHKLLTHYYSLNLHLIINKHLNFFGYYNLLSLPFDQYPHIFPFINLVTLIHSMLITYYSYLYYHIYPSLYSSSHSSPSSTIKSSPIPFPLRIYPPLPLVHFSTQQTTPHYFSNSLQPISTPLPF